MAQALKGTIVFTIGFVLWTVWFLVLVPQLGELGSIFVDFR